MRLRSAFGRVAFASIIAGAAASSAWSQQPPAAATPQPPAAGTAQPPAAGTAQPPTTGLGPRVAPAPAAAAAPAPAVAGANNAPPPIPPWFNEMDTNKDNYVTREEFVAARLKVFGELDVDKDNLLTQEEFLKLAEPPHSVDGPDVPPLEERRKYFADQFQRIDVDRDGKVSREEVEAFVLINFNDFDLNRDGRISKPEIIQVVLHQQQQAAAARGPRVPDAMTREQFLESQLKELMELDSNSDGKVSLDEFLVSAGPADNDPNLPKGTPPLAQRRQALTQRFRELDANKDGFIDRGEWTKLLEKRFAELDANKDGKITQQEIKDHIEKQQRAAAAAQRQAAQPPPQRPAAAAPPAPRPAPPPQPGAGGMVPGVQLPQR